MQKLTQKDGRAQFKSLTYKTLGEKHGYEIFCDLRLGNDLFDMTPNCLSAQVVIEKNGSTGIHQNHQVLYFKRYHQESE